MADIASDTALQHLKSLYPYGQVTSSSDVIQNPWYIIVLVSFSFGNRPEAVPHLFNYVLRELEHAQNQFKVPTLEANREKLLLARRFRDAIFKGGIVGGYSKAINSLISLLEATPEELRDTERQSGEVFFRALYDLLDKIYPDMGWFSNTIAYGSVYGHTEILNQLETSYVLVGSLIAVDTPLQIAWHLDNARRGGSSLEQARAIRQIAIEASQSTGVTWKNDVPEVK
ncbi:hypothetical protein BJV77DRAFT_1058615 [Russula vinacea]|nr:hypothetical protein BJV77DRAFT_1058615 [Russula vinacea]